MGARTRDPADAQQGSALIWALLFVVISSGMVIAHAISLSASRRSTETRRGREALLGTVLDAGVVDSTGWFRRQEVQPVTAFAPRLDPAGLPPAFDTIDPGVGIVREYQIDGGLWARYEVRNSEVADVSAQFSLNPGAAWDLVVRAFVYERNDPSAPYDRAPNRIVFSDYEATTAMRMGYSVPVLSALVTTSIGELELGSDTTIDGGGKPGVGYLDLGSDVAAAEPVGSIVGVPAKTGVTTVDLSPAAVFGLPFHTIAGLADETFEPGDEIDVKDGVTVVAGTVVETDKIKAKKSVVLIDGDLQLDPAAEGKFDGLLYVNGDLIALGKFDLKGSLVVNGRLVTGDEKVKIKYDQKKLDKALRHLERYRAPRVRSPGN